MNRGQLNTQASLFAGDPTKSRYTGLYDNAANQAQDQFAMDCRALWKDATDTTVDGTATYDLPTDFMYEDYVILDGKPLGPITRNRLHELSPGDDWTEDEGRPTHYTIDPEEAQKKIRLYPTPQAGDADKTISIRYFPKPAAMTADSDEPLNSSDLMVQFHLGLAAFQAWLLLMTETMPSQEQNLKKQELLTVYNDAVAKAQDTFKNTVSAPMRVRPRKSWGNSGWGIGQK